VDNQATRLEELTSHDRDLKEAPLRRDVRSLGRLLGEVLKEQVGDKFFSAVEELRLLLIEHRELHAQPEHRVANSSPHDSRLLHRASEPVDLATRSFDTSGSRLNATRSSTQLLMRRVFRLLSSIRKDSGNVEVRITTI